MNHLTENFDFKLSDGHPSTIKVPPMYNEIGPILAGKEEDFNSGHT